jgi:hypothetical protein
MQLFGFFVLQKFSENEKKGTKTSFEQGVDVPFEKKLQESHH